MSDLRTCKQCGSAKDITEFAKVGTRKQYHSKSCRDCERPFKRAKHAEWRHKNTDHYRNFSRENMRRWRANMTPERRIAYLDKMREEMRRRRQAAKDQVYAAYGGYKCACCGETEPKFLSIDHVNNDGYEKRKNGDHFGGGLRFHQAIIAAGFPKDFQVLCMNCNFGKAQNGGVCPHKEPSTTSRKT